MSIIIAAAATAAASAITILTIIIIELWVCFTSSAGILTLTPTEPLKVRSSQDLRLTDFSSDG